MRPVPFFEWLQNAFVRLSTIRTHPGSPGASDDGAGHEAFAAARALSRLLMENRTVFAGDTSDIPNILGNLFRAQGDIDRAVKLREALLVHPDANEAHKARTFFELACDYRKAGLLDRAQMAYKEARRFGFDDRAIRNELAYLFADSGDFVAAALELAAVANPQAEAYFLVMQAREQAGTGNDQPAIKLLRQALVVSPESPEALLALTCMNLMNGDWRSAHKQFAPGLAHAGASPRLILLEGLHAYITGPAAPAIPTESLDAFVQAVGADLTFGRTDLLLCYYGGLFMQRMKKTEEAEQWFTKTLLLDPEFWAARLALLALVAERETLAPLLANQIAFFSQKASESKRFFCRPCGMRRDSVFSFCPRCRAWHSIAFRLYLN